MANESVIIRNGRSTSQVSIYDYPEHLNPFYEDENHKRLRFWKLGSFKKNGESRRGSFSMAGLKEMWAFKSFRLKKKSSSLGINKTSESPPPLRRNMDSSELHYGTYDPRMRNTTGINTLNGYFQRNVPYRSSLHDMRSTQDIDRNGYDIGFTRNDRYRCTIQPTSGLNSNDTSPRPTPARRYVYGGSVTPQPSIHSNFSDDYRGISRGSSQTSVVSTNPFDNEENDGIAGNLSNDKKIKVTPSKQTPRKKRRAPPPPVPVPKIIIEESSSNPPTPSTSQTNQNEENVENIEEITNLAAEIENFVKTKSDINIIQDNQNDKGDETTINTITTVTSTTNDVNVEIPVTVHSQERETEEKLSTNKEKEISKIGASSSLNETTENQIAANISTEEELTLDNNLKIEENSLTQSKDKNNLDKEAETIPNLENTTNKENEANGQELEIVMVSSSNINAEDNEPDLPSIELKITESKEDLSIKSETSNDTTTSNGGSTSGRFHVRYIPLKDSSPEPEPEIRTHTDFTKNYNNELKESNENGVSYERRRSVKEIIESINRSQSLLKVSQEQLVSAQTMASDTLINNLNQPINVKPPPRKKHETKENIIRNLKDISESEREINRMIQEMETSADKMVKPSTEAEVDELIEKLTDKLNNNEDNNNEIFKKCAIKKEISQSSRESSPTSSNLDWNPVPKPKRTKNLSPQLTKIKPTKIYPEN